MNPTARFTEGSSPWQPESIAQGPETVKTQNGPMFETHHRTLQNKRYANRDPGAMGRHPRIRRPVNIRSAGHDVRLGILAPPGGPRTTQVESRPEMRQFLEKSAAASSTAAAPGCPCPGPSGRVATMPPPKTHSATWAGSSDRCSTGEPESAPRKPRGPSASRFTAATSSPRKSTRRWRRRTSGTGPIPTSWPTPPSPPPASATSST